MPNCLSNPARSMNSALAPHDTATGATVNVSLSIEHNLGQQKTPINAGNFEPKNYRHFSEIISVFSYQRRAGMKDAASLAGEYRLTEIATGGPELRRMREGGRIPFRRKKGKRQPLCFHSRADGCSFPFLFLVSFLSLLCKGGVGVGFVSSLSFPFSSVLIPSTKGKKKKGRAARPCPSLVRRLECLHTRSFAFQCGNSEKADATVSANSRPW